MTFIFKIMDYHRYLTNGQRSQYVFVLIWKLSNDRTWDSCPFAKQSSIMRLTPQFLNSFPTCWQVWFNPKSCYGTMLCILTYTIRVWFWKQDNFAIMDMQTTFTNMKTTFRNNHIFVLNYPIHLCVNAKFNTLYLGQYLSHTTVKAILFSKDLPYSP